MSEVKWKFSSIEDYADVYRSATDAEFKIEKAALDKFNDAKQGFRLWIISQLTQKALTDEYIVRLDPKQFDKWKGFVDWDLPQVGEGCTIGIYNLPRESGRKCGTEWFYATRTPDLIPLSPDWEPFIELQLSVPRHSERHRICFADLLPRLAKDGDVTELRPNNAKACEVMVELKISETTCWAELSALSAFRWLDPDGKSVRAFRHLALFEGPSSHVNLFDKYPHMDKLDKITNSDLRKKLQADFDRLDEDQLEAYEGLRHIPEGVFLLPGGTGAGKTLWSLLVATMAQAGEERVKVLYLMDINKPLNDAANEMFRLYKRLGMSKTVIRMYKWPVELAKGEDKRDTPTPTSAQASEPRFANSFMQQADRWEKLAAYEKDREEERAPTLDEAAWRHFNEHREGYPEIQHCLDEIKEEGLDGVTRRDMNTALERLYGEILCAADFIACTPVAARCHFGGMFSPDLVIFDECAHARELSTLIPIAFFRPTAWLFVGDPRQRSPYTSMPQYIPPPRRDNWSGPQPPSGPFSRLEIMRHGRQLRISMIERAVEHSANAHNLLINHRAYGRLHGLPSYLFYDGKMRSPLTPQEMFPTSVVHLRSWLSAMAGRSPDFEVPRLVINLKQEEGEPWERGGREDEDWRQRRRGLGPSQKAGKSQYNPLHLDFVMEKVSELLGDPEFLQVGSTEPGTILILSPYREACNRYHNKITFLAPEVRGRVESRTVGQSLTVEADFVFLDLVSHRPSSFLDDGKMLCAALTRARQGELIMMSRGLAEEKSWSDGYLKKLWEACENAGAVFTPKTPSAAADSLALEHLAITTEESSS